MSRTIHERNLESDMDNHIFEIRGKFYKGHCSPGLNDYIHEIGKNPKAGNRMKQQYQMIACNAVRLGLKRFKTDKPTFCTIRLKSLKRAINGTE